MPWPLVLLDEAEWLRRQLNRELRPGDCTYARFVLDDLDHRSKELGSNYLSLPNSLQHPRRAPILIRLPHGDTWCPDCMAWSEAQGLHGAGWAISGELPNVTITPSINCVGSFHGFVQSGQITDDCEGRKFKTPLPRVDPPQPGS